MDLNWLEDFLALNQTRNFSRAAELRHVTQPAFSRRIRALEQWFGTQVFLRSPKGVTLSAAGELLLDHAGRMVSDLHRLRREVQEISTRDTVTLSFAATHALSFTFFPGFIRKQAPFQALAALNLISNSMEACEQMMLRGEAHFLLCHYYAGTPMPLQPGAFHSLIVGTDTLMPLCAPDARGKPRWPLSMSGGEATRYLSYSSQSGLGRILDTRWTTQQRPPLSKVFTSHLAATLQTMAREGHGIAWLPRTLAADDIAAGRLVEAGETEFAVPLEIRLFRSVRRQVAIVEDFWEGLAAVYTEGKSGRSEID